ncbi:MAG: arginine--tRNA ligase [Candidatus Diapherotrites archaeon]
MVVPDFKKEFAERVEQVLQKLSIPSPGVETLISFMTIPPSVEKGNISLPVFKFTPAEKNPTAFALQLTANLHADTTFEKFQAMGPYLNAFVSIRVYAQHSLSCAEKVSPVPTKESPLVIVEYASPNTNKPLHMGHLRNIALADSIIRLLQHEGKRVLRTQIVNNRGVHICKSMLAYQKWGNNKTPETEKMKPDHFVGKYYTLFAQQMEKDEKLEQDAQNLLLKWEQGDEKTIALWKKMNAWAEKGWKETFEKVGAVFDQNYYESEIYEHGKEVVQKGLEKGLFIQAENGGIIAPLEKKYHVPDKPIMRGDGTSLYITQDIYLAMKRFEDYPDAERIIYVVGNEQEMHFKQLFAILDLLGFEQGKKCHHLGYGLLVLPSGKMSSRMGTVVNADDVIAELEKMALLEYQKRSPEIDDDEVRRRSQVVALAALKFFMVKQDAKKELVFDPKESLSFDGQTGPYLLYTNARIQSILRKTTRKPSTDAVGLLTLPKEREILALLSRKQEIITSTLTHYSPHVLAHYLLELANTFNSYYHDTKVIQENESLEKARLALLKGIHHVFDEGLFILGIETLKEM